MKNLWYVVVAIVFLVIGYLLHDYKDLIPGSAQCDCALSGQVNVTSTSEVAIVSGTNEMVVEPVSTDEDQEIAIVDANVIEKHQGYITAFTQQDGGWNLKIDYIEFNKNRLPGVDSTGGPIINNNPLIRTFPVSDGATLRLLLTDGGGLHNVSTTEFQYWLTTSQNAGVPTLVYIYVQNGVIVKIEQIYMS